MGHSTSVSELVNAANQGLQDPDRNQRINRDGREPTRFELYHAENSICSQKVRAVLYEINEPYISHDMIIFSRPDPETGQILASENYAPDYVRLRLRGGELLNAPLSEGYSGCSAVETEGFDACVVPILIDHEKEQVIVDSRRICEYLDHESSKTNPLIPKDRSEEQDLAEWVSKQVQIIDVMPQPALLYGAHPDDDRRPDFVKSVMSTAFENKLSALEELLKANSEDADLSAAYSSKIAREKAGAAMSVHADRQRSIRDETIKCLHELEQDLSTYPGPWISGELFSMADIYWGVSLYRFQWLGLAFLWEDLPAVKNYISLVYRRASIWEDVIHYPTRLPKSPYVAELLAEPRSAS